jgi:hypothetical protein
VPPRAGQQRRGGAAALYAPRLARGLHAAGGVDLRARAVSATRNMRIARATAQPGCTRTVSPKSWKRCFSARSTPATTGPECSPTRQARCVTPVAAPARANASASPSAKSAARGAWSSYASGHPQQHI